jgi:HK97 family phage portal protein
MNFLNLFRAKPEVKASRAMTVSGMRLPSAVWSKSDDYRAFAKEAYKNNVVAFSAVNRIASAIATIKWFVDEGDKTFTEHPMLDLLKKPNPMQSGSEWWRAKIGYLLLSGNSYDERIMDPSGTRVLEIFTHRPDRMSIVPGATGLPRAYVYTLNGMKVTFDADEFTGESDIRHTKLFNPLDDWLGMSPIQSSAFAVDQHNEAMSWMQALLQNSARPSGALIVDKDAALSDDEYNRLQAEVESKHSGARNAGRPMLLEGGLDWKPMGLSPMDMEIMKIKDSAARDISLAFGVPPLLLNIPGDNTYANYREARLGFYEDTIIPLLVYSVDELNSFLSPFFGGARLRPNLDAIEAVAEKRLKMWEMADSSDDLTLDECRAIKGYKPLGNALGATLMSEIRKPKKGEDLIRDQQEKSLETRFRELGYG